jgi:hypothetical protein
MSFQECFGFCALTVTVIAGVVAYRVVTSDADFIGMSFFGKTYAFKPPFPRSNYLGTAAPYIRPVNEFLWAFANSNEKNIEFASEDIKAGSDATSILKPLVGLDYERIRLRLRIISSLDPVVNSKPEEGVIRFKGGLDPKEYKVRSKFAAKGQSIFLEKL